MNARQWGEIRIDTLRIRVPGANAEHGEVLARRVASQLVELLPGDLSGDIESVKLEVRVDEKASDDQIAGTIARSIVKALVRGAGSRPQPSPPLPIQSTHSEGNGARPRGSLRTAKGSGVAAELVRERSAGERHAFPVDPYAEAAERQADAIGARIGDELEGIGDLRGGGLPDDVRAVAERYLGTDLSGTQILADSKAHRRAESLDALAVTEGSTISFGAGQLSTNSREGRALLGHELTHVAQQRSTGAASVQLKPRRKQAGKATSDPEAARVANLKAAYTAAVSGNDWQQAALLLNAFAQHDLDLRLRQLGGTEQAELRRGAVRAMPGFSGRVTEAIDALNPGARRIATLIDEYESHLAAARWLKAALVLNGFNDVDIGSRLDRLSQLQLASLKVAAQEGMKGFSDRIVKPIDQRLTIKTRPVTVAESSVLSHMEGLAIAARAEGGDGQSFSDAANELRLALRVSLETVAPGAALPDDLAIVMKALMLWDQDPGTKWGAGIWDSSDVVPTATDYATVPSEQYKCNAYVAEVVFQSVGLVFKVYASQEAPGKFFPFRAADWGNPKTSIPHFPVVTAPARGDVWSSGTHVGIYLGEYAGRPLFVSARDNGDGVFGLQNELQRLHGVQIKVLPRGGVYRRYTP